MTHGARWEQLRKEHKICNCTGLFCYKKNNIWFCNLCNRPKPEPLWSIHGKSIRTVRQSHADVTGVSMSYYDKHWMGNAQEVMVRHLEENNNVYKVGSLP